MILYIISERNIIREVRKLFSIVGVLALFLLVIVFVIAAVAKGSPVKEGDEEEMIKHIYTYLVLFVTLMMTIGGSVAVFMAVADIISPSPYYQSFDDYKYSMENRYDKLTVEGEVQEKPNYSDEELQARYNTMVTEEKAKQVNRAKNTLIKSLGWIIIPFPIFLYCQWRLAKKKD